MKDTKFKASCHCGKSENHEEKLIYCVKCKRLLHAECIESLNDEEIMYGDRFYILVCSVCNSGSEYVARLEITWSEFIELVLYHLTIFHHQKYLDLDRQILPFIIDNWTKLNLFGSILSTAKEDRRSEVLQILENNSSRFKNGKEIKKSKHIWALREKIPPQAPPVYPSSAKLQNDKVIWEFQVENRSYHILRKKKPRGNRNNSKNGKDRHKIKLTATSNLKKIEVSKCQGGLPYNENGIHKTKNKSTKCPKLPVFNEDSAKSGLLDLMIPYPPNFNPFGQSKIDTGKTVSSQSQNKTAVKRRWNGNRIDIEAMQVNGDKQPAKVPYLKLQRDIKDSISDAKDNFSQISEKSLVKDYSIMGKRITSMGKTQYLFQKRDVTETAPIQFKIKILCDCPNCKP